jgi:GNAT superfamily N-acetyltransferase
VILGQETDLYRLREKDAVKAGAVMADAFCRDPLWNAVLGLSRPGQKTGVFEVPVRYCLRYGQVYAPSERLEGVITWVRGELADMTFWRLARSGAIWPGLKAALSLSARLLAVFRPLDVDRKENMRGRPYLYIPMLGIASAHQGHGYGSRLLRGLIAESERANSLLYLETETEDNVRWYESFGFETIRQVNLPVIHLPIWEMARGDR